MACHAQQGTGTEVISFVGSPHDQRTINCSTCHTAHVATDPMRDQKKQMSSCRRCHRRQIEEHPRFESKSIEFDKLSCGTCHDVHIAGVEDEQGLGTIGRESE
jgi:predicted CXXCH cytochrome family protein